MNEKISRESKKILLQVARKSLENFLKISETTTFKVHSRELLKHRAVFVTLKNKFSGELCGCIGHSEARYPLFEAVAKTVILSASEDPRFPSLKKDELKNILIEINVLSKLEKILPNKIEIGKHGLILKKGTHSALFLPEVPVNQGWNRENFLDELSLKAALKREEWKNEETQIFSFESESWSEK